jgi:ATP-binding protein involved in chromosome partitioning
MFREVRVPILGLVENMAFYHCRKCGKEHAVFGRDGGKKLAEEENVPLLARLPIDPRIGETVDSGRPLALEEEGDTAEAFRRFAVSTAAAVGRLSLDKSPFPVLS